jgi:hypothetical protein
MPSFHEWLLARGALPVQAHINPLPTTKAHLGRLRAGPPKSPRPAARRAVNLVPRWPA